jgi:hypothetical protein
LLAGAEGVGAAPNMFVGGAVEVVLGFDCAFELKPNRLLEGAVAVVVATSVAGALIPNRLFCGVSCWTVLPFCALAPNPLKMLFCAGAALPCVVPNPPNVLLVAGVLAGCALELMAPKLKGVGAGAGVLMAFAAELVVPNMLFEGALMLPPNILPVLGALVVIFCERPANGLLGTCELNIDAPPKAVGVLLPLVAGALLTAKGLLLPAVKLKSFTVGGWGLKPVLWLLAPKAGKDELTNELLGALDWAGGKLLVAPPPNALIEAPNRPLVLLLLLLPPTAGADAPKVKPGCCCGVPKLALCDGVCEGALANRLS